MLLIGNDPTNQNPLVAWQIRSGIRHFGSKLFVINANEIKLVRKATQFIKVAAGHENAAIKWLAHGEGLLAPEMVEQLVALKAALEAESDVAIVFGEELTGAAIAQLVTFGSKLNGRTASWPSAITPIRAAQRTWACSPTVCRDMPTPITRKPAKCWKASGAARFPRKAGLTAPEMIDAAQSGKLQGAVRHGRQPFGAFWHPGLRTRQWRSC